jgi:hypothetical protein
MCYNFGSRWLPEATAFTASSPAIPSRPVRGPLFLAGVDVDYLFGQDPHLMARFEGTHALSARFGKTKRLLARFPTLKREETLLWVPALARGSLAQRRLAATQRL